jgi:hypothetical protein
MIKEVVIFLLVLILLSLLIHSKLNNNIENFENSFDYLSNGTVTKLYGIQNFKLDDESKEYLIFNGESSFLKIPSVDSENFVLSFKMKTGKMDNHLLSGSSGSINFKLVEGKLRVSSPFLDGDHTNNVIFELDKPYSVEIGVKGEVGYISIDDNKSEFNLTSNLKVGDIFIGKDFSSTRFFLGEIADVKMVKHDMESKNLGALEPENNKCNWNPIGVTKQECIENCELFNGCEGKTDKCREICGECVDENKCEWLQTMCTYNAAGEDYTDCVYKCIKNKNCEWEKCVSECSNCGRDCPWTKKQNENLNKYYEPPKKGSDGEPGRPRIRVETSTGMVSIYWNAPDSGNAPIETYIYFLYKTFKRNEGVKIGLIPFPKCRNCFHVLDNLDPNETYSVGIRAYNSYGGIGALGEMSNIETFKPKLERNKNDIGLISLETLSNNDAYMNNYHYCNN